MTEEELKELAAATVRVEGGAGFFVQRERGPRIIATAAHVVRDIPRPRVSWPGGAGPVDVLSVDRDTDVAILSDRPEHTSPGLRFAAPDAPATIGTPIWTAGFPQGWQDLSPVLSTGIVAGVGMETWLNLVSTWGNSGGPVVTASEDGLRVVGLVTGHGSKVHQDLDKAVSQIHSVQQQLTNAFAGGGGVVMMGIDFGRFAGFMAHALGSICGLVEGHFRSGYVRIATAASVRAALGG